MRYVPSLLGKTLPEAHKLAAEADLVLRVAKRDGAPTMGTADMRYNRLNVEVEEGVVTKIRGIF